MMANGKRDGEGRHAGGALSERLATLEAAVEALREAAQTRGGASSNDGAYVLEGRVAALEQAVRSMEEEEDEGDGGWPVNSMHVQTHNLAPNRPFSMRYDLVQEAWKMYLPAGCVRVGSAVAEWAGSGERSGAGEVEISRADALYLHVWKASDLYKFSVDATQVRTPGAKEKAICDIMAVEMDDGGVVVEHVKGVLFIGTGGAEAVTGGGCYELAYDENTGTTSFANCYYCFGAVLKSGPTGGTDGADQYAPGFVALKIEAAGSSAGTATLQGYSSFAAMASESENPAYIIVPLYELDTEVVEEEGSGEGEGGSGTSLSEEEQRVRTKVVCDFRTMPRAQVVEILANLSPTTN